MGTDSSCKCLGGKGPGTGFLDFLGDVRLFTCEKPTVTAFSVMPPCRIQRWAQGEMQLNSPYSGDRGSQLVLLGAVRAEAVITV